MMPDSFLPGDPPQVAVREELRTTAGPIVVFNKSHSGSRLLDRGYLKPDGFLDVVAGRWRSQADQPESAG